MTYKGCSEVSQVSVAFKSEFGSDRLLLMMEEEGSRDNPTLADGPDPNRDTSQVA